MNKEISILQYLKKLLEKIWIVAILTVVGAALMFVYSYFFITPQYTSSAKMIVSNKTANSLENSNSTSNSDIYASTSLVKTYTQVIKNRNFMKLVCDKIELYKTNPDYKFLEDCTVTPEELSKSVKVSAIDETEVFLVSLALPDPEEANFIVDTITELLPDFAKDRVKNSTVVHLEDATLPTSPSSPNIFKYTAIGAGLGFIIAAALIFLLLLTDTVIYTEEELTEKFENINILGTIPLMHSDASKAAHDSKAAQKQ